MIGQKILGEMQFWLILLAFAGRYQSIRNLAGECLPSKTAQKLMYSIDTSLSRQS